MLSLGTQEDKGRDPPLRCQRALAFGQKWDPTRAAAGCSCHAAYPRWGCKALEVEDVKRGCKEAKCIQKLYRTSSYSIEPWEKSESANSRFQFLVL